MPRLPKGEMAGDFTPVPDGSYLCEVAEVRDRNEDGGSLETQHGDDMFRIRFEIVRGPYAGRNIWDNMVFSEKAYPRVRLMCKRMGIDISEDVDVTPQLLMGRQVIVTTIIEERPNEEGEMRKYNVVPFAGYEPAEEGRAGKSDLPF